MDDQNDTGKDINSISGKLQNKSHLPTIALAFGCAPIMFMLLWRIPFPPIGIILGYLFFGSGWGIGFQFIGFIFGIIALCNRKKHIGVIGLTFSIIAILSPFIWGYVLYYQYNYKDMELFL